MDTDVFTSKSLKSLFFFLLFQRQISAIFFFTEDMQSLSLCVQSLFQGLIGNHRVAVQILSGPLTQWVPQECTSPFLSYPDVQEGIFSTWGKKREKTNYKIEWERGKEKRQGEEKGENRKRKMKRERGKGGKRRKRGERWKGEKEEKGKRIKRGKRNRQGQGQRQGQWQGQGQGQGRSRQGKLSKYV